MVTVPPPLNTLFLGSMALYNCTCHSKVISSKVKDHSSWYKISHFYFVFVWKGQYARVFSHRGTDSYWIGELLWKYTQSVWEKPRNIRTLVVVSIRRRGKKREKRMMIIQREKRHDRGPLHSHNISPLSILNLFSGSSNFLLLKSVILDNVRHTQLKICNLFKVTFRFKQDENE